MAERFVRNVWLVCSKSWQEELKCINVFSVNLCLTRFLNILLIYFWVYNKCVAVNVNLFNVLEKQKRLLHLCKL